MKKFFCILLTGAVLFNCKFTAHGVYTYSQLLHMGLRNDMENSEAQEIFDNGNLSSDEVYEFLKMGIFSLSEIVSFHSRNISTETIRDYIATGVNVGKEFFDVTGCIDVENPKIALEIHSASSIISLIENNIDVETVRYYVSHLINRPQDIISLVQHNISMETLNSYIRVLLNTSKPTYSGIKCEIEKIVSFVENNVPVDVVRIFAEAGLSDPDIIIPLYKRNVSMDTVRDYVTLGVDMTELTFDQETGKCGISSILSLIDHNIPNNIIHDYVEAGVRGPREIIFLIDHNISIDTVHDYVNTGVYKRTYGQGIYNTAGGAVPLIEHNIPIEVVSGYVNIGIKSAFDIIFAAEHNMSVQSLAEYKEAGLLNTKPCMSLHCIVPIIARGIPASVILEYSNAGVEDPDEIIFLIDHDISADVVREYVSVGLNIPPRFCTGGMPACLFNVQGLVFFAENDVSVDTVRNYVNLGINSPCDIADLIEHNISLEVVGDYLSTGLNISTWLQFQNSKNNREIHKLISLIENNVSIDTVRSYVNLGITTPRDISDFIEQGMSAEEARDHIDNVINIL